MLVLCPYIFVEMLNVSVSDIPISSLYPENYMIAELNHELLIPFYKILKFYKIKFIFHSYRIYYCVTNTLQLPSFSPRSTYFFEIN